ncbi:hypothetical protein F0562_012619 [Nyssa sinensis]|uniref:protein-tyrosine-phosphatase n=1 Tax=Nyssa sinensis TaxID=561372 RepID=A0A5J4ZYE9_9ASTE|nr:hypothetical protein F0562_012619 [Nyssa sinensis]
MAVLSKKNPSPASVETVEEITKIYRSLPPRPTIEEVEAAISVVKTVNTEQQMRLEQISNQVAPHDVPPELFSVFQQMRKTTVLFQSHEQTKEAMHLIELDKMFQTFDELIQRTSELVYGDTQMKKQINLGVPVGEIGSEVVISDESVIKKREVEEPKADDLKGLARSSSAKATVFSSGAFIGGRDTEKLSLMKVAAIIENSAKSGAGVLDLQGKLMNEIEWLPVSLGKLSDVAELNLSENQIMALPSTIVNLRTLTKLDVHSNQLVNLPASFGELLNLTYLDLHANMLKSLPASFGNLMNLINLDLSSNLFTHLPDIIGNLTSLKTLNVETNELQEIPYTIGTCSSLVELRLDFNQLKALPEAVGKLECLEVLTVHYNRIKGLPTTMGNLSNLRELDVSFNELESIPESLCLAVSLEKLNVGKNFADLRALPKSIGNLEKLQELDINDNQIRILPDSFRSLSKLRVFRADETPLEMPPRQVTKLGAQAVVEYMADYVAKRDLKVSTDEEEEEGTMVSDMPIYLALTGDYLSKDIILQVCDEYFFYEQIENCNNPFLDALSQYDDGLDLSDYDFNQDGFSSSYDDINKRKLAYRHRVIAEKYKKGLHSLLDQDVIKLWDDLYDVTDSYTDRWLSSARACLEQCSGGNKELTSCIDSADGISYSTDTKFQHVNVLVTSGSLIPSLVKCLLFRLDDLITYRNVYSSWEVGKLQCFSWIRERFSGPNVRFCVIGDGWEECEAAQTMRWPFVKIDIRLGSSHRFPGLTLRTLGHYFSVVYGDADAENEEQVITPAAQLENGKKRIMEEAILFTVSVAADY